MLGSLLTPTASRAVAFIGLCLIFVGAAMDNRAGSWLTMTGGLVMLGATLL